MRYPHPHLTSNSNSCPHFEPVLLARIDKPEQHVAGRLPGRRRLRGARRRRSAMTPAEVTKLVKDSGLRGRGGAGFPDGREVDVPAEEPSGPDLPVRQRRRERAGHVQQPHPDGGGPAPGARRHHDRAATRSGRTRRTSTCATSTAAATACSQQAIDECYAAGLLGKNILGSGFRPRHLPAPRRRGVHLRRRDRADREPGRQAGLAADQAAVPGRRRRCSASRRSSTTSRRWPA